MATAKLFSVIEKWASESEERSHMLIFGLCAVITIFVLAVIAAIAVILLPPGSLPF